MSGTRRPRRGGGFTLIELVAVVVIVAILAGVSAPALSKLTSARAGYAARDLLRDLTFARQHAVATGAPTWVVIDVPSDSYEIRAETLASPGFVNATVIDDAATGRTFVRTFNTGEYAGVTITQADFDGGATVGFDWLGRPLASSGADLAAAGTITISSGAQVIIAVESGHIELQP